MKKYWIYYKSGLQQTLAYRGPLLIWLLCNLMSMATGLAVWFTSSNNGVLGGYGLSQLVTYYVIGIFVGWTINWNPFPGVWQQIKDGYLSLTLVEPISFLGSRFTWEASWRTISMLIGLAGTVMTAIVLKNYLSFPELNLFYLVIIPAVIMAILINFFFGMCIGLLSFWSTEVQSYASLRWIGLELFGGSAIPISFIPGLLQSVIKLLPFRYMYSFPMEILFSKYGTQIDLLIGFSIQAVWLTILILLYKFLWRRGLRLYTSVGN